MQLVMGLVQGLVDGIPVLLEGAIQLFMAILDALPVTVHNSGYNIRYGSGNTYHNFRNRFNNLPQQILCCREYLRDGLC